MPIPQLRPAERQRPASHGRMKEQRQAGSAPDLYQVAGETARRIIRECGLKDETATWRQIADAVLDAMDVAYHRGAGR